MLLPIPAKLVFMIATPVLTLSTALPTGKWQFDSSTSRSIPRYSYFDIEVHLAYSVYPSVYLMLTLRILLDVKRGTISLQTTLAFIDGSARSG